MKETVRSWIVDIIAFVFGSALVAAGLVLFTIPNDIAPGGVSGLATALAYLSPISVGIWTLLLNIPLIALAWWKLGFRPLAKTIVTTLLLSAFIELFSRILPPYSNNILLALRNRHIPEVHRSVVPH